MIHNVLDCLVNYWITEISIETARVSRLSQNYFFVFVCFVFIFIFFLFPMILYIFLHISLLTCFCFCFFCSFCFCLFCFYFFVCFLFSQFPIIFHIFPTSFNSDNQIEIRHFLYCVLCDYEITLKILEFILNSIEMGKPGVLPSLVCLCMLLELSGAKSKSHSCHLKNSGIFQTRMGQRVPP